ncbi:MAG: hypothetical protein M0026_04550 [Nocardiopsaceae bacterium]|nr:hypothetical protein [Nocardiopsaceae bacterium]
MMAQLRSKTAMYVLATLTTLGLVATGAAGLFNALSAPAPPEASSDAAATADPVPAPSMEELGKAPGGTSYTDLGEQCQTSECFRLVGITSEEEDADGEAAAEAVHEHLLDRGWATVLPPEEGGEAADPDDVPITESYLTNGSVMVQVSTTPYDTESTAGLMLAHAQAPSS